MVRTIWLTEERIAASGTGAPVQRRSCVATSLVRFQAVKPVGIVPVAYGPGLVGRNADVRFRTNDHTAMDRTAWDGTPLGSRGAGYG